MIPASRLVDLARLHIGERYVLGARVPLDLATATGPWDCAELVSWAVYQATGRIVGCTDNASAPDRADPYTGAWERDSHVNGLVRLSVEPACRTPGAILLRAPSEGIGGHIALSTGDGGTIEAYSSTRGVIAGTATGRRWDCGVLLPWVAYETGPAPRRMLRLSTPRMTGGDVRVVQGVVGVDQDGILGPDTARAVVAWQAAHGLVADGVVGPATWAAMAGA